MYNSPLIILGCIIGNWLWVIPELGNMNFPIEEFRTLCSLCTWSFIFSNDHVSAIYCLDVTLFRFLYVAFCILVYWNCDTPPYSQSSDFIHIAYFWSVVLVVYLLVLCVAMFNVHITVTWIYIMLPFLWLVCTL